MDAFIAVFSPGFLVVATLFSAALILHVARESFIGKGE